MRDGTFALVAISCLLPGPVTGQEPVDLRTLNLPRWDLVEEFRLGSVDGEHDAFVRPWGVKRDNRGRLYVLDGGLPALRVFEPTGSFVHQIGRPGEGPGEYTAPVSFGFLGDTVWVVDGTSRRVAFFTMEGEVLGDLALDPERPGVERPLPFNVLGDDDFVIVIPPGPDRFFRGHGVGRVIFEQRIVRRNRTGSRADTMVTYSVEPGFMITQADADGFTVIPYRPIAQLPLLSFYGERDEITEIDRTPATRADEGEFRVTIRRPDGTMVAERRFRYRPVPISGTVKDSIREELGSRFNVNGDPQATRKYIGIALDHLALPDYLPPVSGGIAVGEDGTRWIPRESLPGVTPTTYLVTDASLSPIAMVMLPPNALQLTGWITRESLWVVEKDELDVQYLIRYRIIRPS
jgi:hypothetical protein